MEVRVRSRWFGILGVALVPACSCNGNDGQDTGAGSGIHDLAVEVLPMPTALEVTWTTGATGTGFVEYGIDGAFDRVSTEQTEGTDHAVTLVLLESAKTYQIRAVTLLDDGTRVESEPVEAKIAPPPQDLPRFTAEILDDSAELPGGYVLTTLLGQASYVGIMTGEGTWVWWAEMDASDLSSARARLSRDGRSVLYNVYQSNRADDQGWIVRMSLDGRERTDTRTLLAHHDFVELPDGTLSWLGFEMRTVDVEGTPSDSSLLDGPHPMATDVIYEGAEGLAEGEDPTWVWGFFDDYVAAPWWVCSHVEDIEHSFVPGYHEWTHTNSLAYVDDDDSYYILPRFLDALIKIDRATGSMVWQLGGEHATLPLVSGEPFDHPHVSDIWDGGVLLFDNRDHSGEESESRVVEISWDEAAGTAQVEWEFPHPDGETLPILGDARRLPGGNRLIAWSAKGELVEVTPDGEVVYSATMALGAIPTRVIFFTDADIGTL